MIIFPNPTDNDIVLKFVPTEEGKLCYELYDMQGRKVFGGQADVRVSGGNYFLPIDLPNLSSGHYILRSKLNQKVYNNKI